MHLTYLGPAFCLHILRLLSSGLTLGSVCSLMAAQFSHSVVSLCDPTDCSRPVFPVHHQLPELTQTHVHRVSDAIQPSHLLLSPSPPAFNLSQYQGLFQESVLRIRWPDWNFSFSINPTNEYSRLISFRIDWLDLLQSKGLSRVLSNTTVQKYQFFGIQLSL